MVEAQGRMETPVIMAYMVIAGLIGFTIDKVMLLFESILLRWKAD
ncbi:MAG: nitrate ABC transporter substrate-binding protein [Oscillospiraceae bacterium]|nr:nitrate ABC transporter substrate-binding protein [Oscillospiraceae bacterium]MCI9364590.1 nitrate ABC transporter substrate-binding protein [Oscillospiraceae bacterium]MCI9668864.1 nitrate ABC transporter substrate-binding protein [Oscillospiraceae bacterium]RKJ57814.1 nitrate ABC transporter substrate-binding protein [bacterium 1XD42-8]RKJ66613.1 nitrate ABC transporter substrate-binding protein [bacterium 1XD42-1]